MKQMEKILQLIKEQKERTGLEIKTNPFTMASYVWNNITGKVEFTGDMIECQLFINQYDKTTPQ